MPVPGSLKHSKLEELKEIQLEGCVLCTRRIFPFEPPFASWRDRVSFVVCRFDDCTLDSFGKARVLRDGGYLKLQKLGRALAPSMFLSWRQHTRDRRKMSPQRSCTASFKVSQVRIRKSSPHRKSDSKNCWIWLALSTD